MSILFAFYQWVADLVLVKIKLGFFLLFFRVVQGDLEEGYETKRKGHDDGRDHCEMVMIPIGVL